MEHSGPRVAVIFGGRSSEHEISVITAHQVMDALTVARYRLLPIYVTKQGEWYAGINLYDLRLYRDPHLNVRRVANTFKVSVCPDRSIRNLLPPSQGSILRRRIPKLWADVFFPIMHGRFGEDGTIQGVLEMADVPYVGSGVLASAIAMDKVTTKAICRAAGIPTLDCVLVARAEWEAQNEEVLARIVRFADYPVIAKPVRLGSSIGVKRCRNSHELEEALELALTLDENVLVERAIPNVIEVNCAVLGPPGRVSVCEQPRTDEEILSFDAKYRRGAKGKGGLVKGGMASMDRLIPAPIPQELTDRIQETALRAFRLVGCRGVARVDFLLENDGQQVYLNEINTIPGSLAFYLWEASGVSFDELVSSLVMRSLEHHADKSRTIHTFETNLLHQVEPLA